MTILVVDDHLSQIRLMRSQLSKAGHNVIGCCSGEEAIDRMKSHGVDLVITDMEMDGLTGQDVLQHVRERFRSVPVILMSGNLDKLQKKGFDGYLAKPFTMTELLSAVENAVG